MITEPRIKVENSKFSRKKHTCKCSKL